MLVPCLAFPPPRTQARAQALPAVQDRAPNHFLLSSSGGLEAVACSEAGGKPASLLLPLPDVTRVLRKMEGIEQRLKMQNVQWMENTRDATADNYRWISSIQQCAPTHNAASSPWRSEPGIPRQREQSQKQEGRVLESYSSPCCLALFSSNLHEQYESHEKNLNYTIAAFPFVCALSYLRLRKCKEK